MVSVDATNKLLPPLGKRGGGDEREVTRASYVKNKAGLTGQTFRDGESPRPLVGRPDTLPTLHS